MAKRKAAKRKATKKAATKRKSGGQTKSEAEKARTSKARAKRVSTAGKKRRADLQKLKARADKNAEKRTREAQTEARKAGISRSPKGKPARRGSGAGRPPFVPTTEQRAQVEMMAATGALKQEQIVLLVVNPETGRPVSLETLRKHFARELDTGLLKANAKVAQSLFRRATKGGPQAVSAAIWWEKTRTGMKETVSVEVEDKSGVLISPAHRTPAEWIKDAADKAKGAAEPGAS